MINCFILQIHATNNGGLNYLLQIVK